MLAAAFSFPRDPRVRDRASAASLNLENPFPCKRGFAGTELARQHRTDPTCPERLLHSSIQLTVSCGRRFFSRFLFVFIWEYSRGRGGRGDRVFGASRAKLQRAGWERELCALEMERREWKMHARAFGDAGAKGREGVAASFSFSDVLLAILVKLMLFLLVAA